MKLLLSTILFLLISIANAQIKFKVIEKETNDWKNIYSLVDEYNQTIKVLDSAKYYISWNGDEYGYFAVFGKKDNTRSAWVAIDANENILFYVYNTGFGEPNPDYLIENKIRIVNDENKIGFANEKGHIIIEPQFEIATSFHNGKAIIGQKCEKVPWGNHEIEDGCNHYSIVCENHGYINETGEIIKLGNYTFEQIMEEINWKPDEE